MSRICTVAVKGRKRSVFDLKEGAAVAGGPHRSCLKVM